MSGQREGLNHNKVVNEQPQTHPSSIQLHVIKKEESEMCFMHVRPQYQSPRLCVSRLLHLLPLPCDDPSL